MKYKYYIVVYKFDGTKFIGLETIYTIGKYSKQDLIGIHKMYEDKTTNLCKVCFYDYDTEELLIEIVK